MSNKRYPWFQIICLGMAIFLTIYACIVEDWIAAAAGAVAVFVFLFIWEEV